MSVNKTSVACLKELQILGMYNTEGDEDGEETEYCRSSEQTHQIFNGAQELKDKLRADIGKKKYDVCNMYHDRGIFQYIARSGVFETATLVVIALNAVWIAVDTDYNRADVLLDAPVVFQVGEHFFCFYFTLELMVRYGAFRRKVDSLSDYWFLFDSVLVMLMVLETWVMTLLLIIFGTAGGGKLLGNMAVLRIARVIRLTRMARVARLFRAMPELLIIVRGLSVAIRSVFFVLSLLMMIIYVLALTFTQIATGESRENYFPNVPKSIYTLVVYSIDMDGFSVVLEDLNSDNWLCAIIFGLFILLAGVTMMNMLVGVLCEVVSVVAMTEREALILNFVKDKLQDVLQFTGMEMSETEDRRLITKSDFVAILHNRKATKALQEVGVDVVGLVDFVDYIFEGEEFDEEEKLTFNEFMEVILQLRGSNTATVKDIVDLRKFVRNTLKNMEQYIEQQVRKPGNRALLRLPTGTSFGNSRSSSPRNSLVSNASRLSVTKGTASSGTAVQTNPAASPAVVQDGPNVATSPAHGNSARPDLHDLQARMGRLEDLVLEVLRRLPPEPSPQQTAAAQPARLERRFTREASMGDVPVDPPPSIVTMSTATAVVSSCSSGGVHPQDIAQTSTGADSCRLPIPTALSRTKIVVVSSPRANPRGSSATDGLTHPVALQPPSPRSTVSTGSPQAADAHVSTMSTTPEETGPGSQPVHAVGHGASFPRGEELSNHVLPSCGVFL